MTVPRFNHANVLSRRTLIRASGLAEASLTTAGLAACASTVPNRGALSTGNTVTPSSGPHPDNRPKVLLAYFSRAGENYWNGGRRILETGNTEVLAAMLSTQLGCDVYQIEAADPYSKRYDPTVARNVREQDSDARPQIANALPNLEGYDTVLIGSPIWNVQPPMIMATFIEAVDVAGKTLLPFVTYAVSGLGSTQDFYRALDSGADLGDGLAVRGEEVTNADNDIDQWLRATGLVGKETSP
ncbi:flavodoxin [Arthrobacter sp. CAL618]|uniref:flavodoxin n=1 Tax=Arthrobacter sp. CAL618 TaxID=1055770 RepID=UPI000402647A|nr:flavodoxin [Arthrobacter sp. CAL618]